MSATRTIETERLLLRPVTIDDLDDLVRLHDDPLVSRFMGARDRDWYRWRIGATREEWVERGHGFVAITERSSGTFLGRTGLKFWPEFEETELGWVLRPEARGKGFATEAAGAVLRWGFERFELPYVTAMIRPDNDASIAVAKRLGMSPLRSDELLGDEVVVYARRRRVSRTQTRPDPPGQSWLGRPDD